MKCRSPGTPTSETVYSDLPDRIALDNASRAPSDLNFWSTCQCRDRQPVVSHTAATESHHPRILSKSTAPPMHMSAIPVSPSDAGVEGVGGNDDSYSADGVLLAERLSGRGDVSLSFHSKEI